MDAFDPRYLSKADTTTRTKAFLSSDTRSRESGISTKSSASKAAGAVEKTGALAGVYGDDASISLAELGDGPVFHAQLVPSSFG